VFYFRLAVAINSGCASSIIPESHRLRTEIIFDRIPWDFTGDVATASLWCQEKSNLIVKRVANRELGPLAAFESPLAPSRSHGRIRGNLSLLSDRCDERRRRRHRTGIDLLRDFDARFDSFSSPLWTQRSRRSEDRSCSHLFVLKEEKKKWTECDNVFYEKIPFFMPTTMGIASGRNSAARISANASGK